MKYTIEQLMVVMKPDDLGDKKFVDATMRRVQNPEIISQTIRRMDVKQNKETFIMKLKHLPKFAVIALAIGATLLFSGGVYAAVALLWPKAEVTTGDVSRNSDGRLEVPASLKNCKTIPETEVTAIMRRGTELTTEDVRILLEAGCEMESITQWGSDLSTAAHFPYNSEYQIGASGYALNEFELTDTKFSVPAYKTNITILPKTFKITPDTKYVADGTFVAAKDIKPGDVVTYISKDRYTPTGSDKSFVYSPGDSELIAIVKLSQGIKWYDADTDGLIILQVPCYNNPVDKCISKGSSLPISDYPIAEGQQVDGTTRKTSGKLIRFDNKTMVLKTSSNRMITFVLPENDINRFNQNPPVHFKNLKVEVGDTISVTYRDDSGQTNPTITDLRGGSIELELDTALDANGNSIKY